MNKPTMIKTINAILSLQGKTVGKVTEALNYKTVQAIFEEKLEELHSMQNVEVGGMCAPRDLPDLPEGDDVTEEVPKPVSEETPDLLLHLLKKIEFKFKISQETMDELTVREYVKDGDYHLTFCVNGKYWHENRNRMYKLVDAVKQGAVVRGARCWLERPPRGQAYLVMNWGK